MSAPEIQRCGECGSELPSGLPLSLCPRCVLDSTQDATSVLSQPLFDEEKPQLGRSFGDYELLGEISRGGMGVVYKARQRSLERIVAIKMLLFGTHSSADLIRRFRGEAVLAGGLHHPNIVPIHEVGIHDGQHFIAMDYVDGENLSAYLRTKPISIRDIALCLAKIARAIHYAHERNVLHRDLKPSNVLMDTDGEPHVSDFGLARRLNGESGITISGQVLGSPNYMPPEQAAPKQKKVSRRSDVYGLGAILYHCLTGRPPFQAETLPATLHLVLTAEPIAPRLLNPSVPQDLETICLKCLEKEPGRRYETADELAQELTQFLNNQPIRARPITRAEKLVRWCRRNPPLATALAAAAMFFITGFATSTWQAARAKREANESRLSLYVADMNLAQMALQRNDFASVREKLIAHLPKAGWPDLRGWEWRYLWKTCESEHVQAWRSTAAVHAVAVSQDGLIAAATQVSSAGTILLNQQLQTLTNFNAVATQFGHRSLAFSPEGTVLAMAKGRGVLLAHSGAWDTEELVSKRSGNVNSLAFLPDGRRLVAASSGGLKAWDIVAGEEIAPPVPFTNECRKLDVSADGQWLALSTPTALLAWNVPQKSLLFSQAMGPQELSALALSRDGLLAACDRDGFVRIWNLNAFQQVKDGTNNPIVWNTRAGGPNYSAVFSPDGTMLAIAGSDQLIRIYHTSDWKESVSFKGHLNEIWTLAFAQDGNSLVSGGNDRFIRVWNPRLRPSTRTLPGTWIPLSFTPDTGRLVTLNPRRVLQLWNTETSNVEETFKPLTNIAPEFVEITPDSRTVLAKTGGKLIHLLDRKTGESHGTLKLDTSNLESVFPRQCSPDSRWVAVETRRQRDGNSVLATELFDLKTRERIATIDDLMGLRFSPDGRYLGGKNSRQQPVLWDLQRQERHLLTGFTGKLNSVAFSRDGLFAASSGHVVQIWDIASGRLQRTLKGHRAGVGKILFSQDSRTLFSTSTDRTLKFWNVKRGQEVLSVNCAEDTFELALSADDTTLAVGGLDIQKHGVALWHAPSLASIDAPLKGNQR